MNYYGTENIELFLTCRKYLKIVHHIPGRVRFKVEPSIAVVLPENFYSEDISIFPNISGIKSVQFKIISLSIIIEYETSTIEPSFWETLLGLKADSEVELMIKRFLPSKDEEDNAS